MHNFVRAALLSGLVSFASLAAHADTTNVFNLDVNACTGCTGTSAGTVTVFQASGWSNYADVTVNLAPGFTFHEPPNQHSQQHWAFTANDPFTNMPATQTTPTSPMFTYLGYSPSGYSQAGIGSFDYAWSLTGHSSNSGISSVTFQLTVPNQSGINVANSFTGFAADIFETVGNQTFTGNYGTGTMNPPPPPPPAVPEPSTLALLGTGLCGLAGLARRK